MHEIQERRILFAFKIGIFLKGLFALFEMLGGTVLFFINKAHFIPYILTLFRNELSDDPHDFVANVIVNGAAAFSVSSQYAIALYFLLHGFVKFFLIISLLKNKLWAYPSAIVVFSIFTGYELYRYSVSNSSLLLYGALFDLIVLILIIFEFIRQKKA